VYTQLAEKIYEKIQVDLPASAKILRTEHAQRTTFTQEHRSHLPSPLEVLLAAVRRMNTSEKAHSDAVCIARLLFAQHMSDDVIADVLSTVLVELECVGRVTPTLEQCLVEVSVDAMFTRRLLCRSFIRK